MKRLINILTLTVTIGLALSSHGAVFDFSYQFSDTVYSGDGSGLVAGTLQGTQNGNFLDNVAVLTLAINGAPVTEPLFTAQYSPLGWINNPVVSFDAAKNNFGFFTYDIVNSAQHGQDNWGYFSMIPVFAGYSYLPAAAVYNSSSQFVFAEDSDQFVRTSNWQLTVVPETSTAALLCLGLGIILSLTQRRSS